LLWTSVLRGSGFAPVTTPALDGGAAPPESGGEPRRVRFRQPQSGDKAKKAKD
jgi:hypothetical protein